MTVLTSTQRTALRGLFAAVFLVVVLSIVFFAVGCSAPRWFVGQKKVPTDVATPAATTQGQKRAAKYIANATRPPVANAPAVVVDVHEVAVGLSASLGEPDKPVTLDDRAAVIESLAAGLRAKDAQLERWREFGRKYGGKPLEDTGINLAGPAGFLGLLAVVVACVFVPGFGWVLLRLLPVLWSALKQAARALESVARAAPEAVARVKESLPQREGAVRKLIRAAKPQPIAP